MSPLSKLFRIKAPQIHKPNGEPKTSGELIAEVTEGANLVEGKQTWEYAEEKKHDIGYMKKCCDAELKTMEKAGLVPAPYYFERVAILDSGTLFNNLIDIIAKKLEMSLAGVEFSVDRGESIAKNCEFLLID